MKTKLTFLEIQNLQKQFGVQKTQEQINLGLIWHFEGSMGRFAMDLLEGGICMLPKAITVDYWGNKIPPRDVLKPGTKGSFKNCELFWLKVYNGEFDAIDYLENTFGIVEQTTQVN